MLSEKDESILNALASNNFEIMLLDNNKQVASAAKFIFLGQRELERSFEVEFPKNLPLEKIFEQRGSHFLIAKKETKELFLCYIPETDKKALALRNLSEKKYKTNYIIDNFTNDFLAVSDGKVLLYTNLRFLSTDSRLIDGNDATQINDEKIKETIITSAKVMLETKTERIEVKEEQKQKFICKNIIVSMTPINSQGTKLALIELTCSLHPNKCLEAESKLERISSCLDIIAKRAYQNYELFNFIAEIQKEIISICKFETIFTTIRKKDTPEKTIISGNEKAIDNDILNLSMQQCAGEEKPLCIDYIRNEKTYFCRVLPLWIKTGNIGEMVFIALHENRDILFEMDNLISTIRVMLELQIHKNAHMQNAIEIEKLRSFRSEILETVNHDMKTPLTSIMGYAELLNMGLISEKSQIAEVGKSLQNAGNQMLGLIKELDKLSKQTIIVPKLSITEIDTESFIKDSAKLMMPIFESSGLEFKISIKGKLPKIKGDISKLYEIVLNLLSNASKYTESGGKVILGAERMMNNYVKIYIQDTGIGIPLEKRRMIFNKYSRISINKPGTGLGLYLSKVYTESMGGKLFVESEGENRGSTFYLMMPSI